MAVHALAVPALQPLVRAPLPRQVFDQLAEQIVSGAMEPGTTLPAERTLAERLGVNRGAVREGLKQLAQAGLIRTRHGGGSEVLDFRRHASLDLLGSLLFRDGRLVPKVARDVLEMRAALAPEIARRCAERRPDEIARRCVEHAEAMARTDDLHALQDLALAFWDDVVAGAGNVAYELAFNTLRTTYDKFRRALAPAMAGELRDRAGHAALAHAITERDASAARRAAESVLARSAEGFDRVLSALAGTASKSF